MWTDGNGTFYFGDCKAGDRAATAEEIAMWKAAHDKVAANSAITTQIAALETKQARGVREAVLAGNLTYLQVIETQISALRAQLLKP
jgi:hypothetical protein